MRSITAFRHDSFVEHEPPAGEFEAEWTGRLAVEEPHPDRPERILNVEHVLRHELGDRVTWRPAPPATDEQLQRVHEPEHVSAFEAFCEAGGGRLTSETGANEASARAARHAAGAAAASVRHALEGGPDRVPYACVRPSGHHAQPAQVDGFCFYNNAAVAVEEALIDDGVDRVAVLDWDVHHGNGTQEIFYDRDDVLTISLHNDHWSWDPEAHPQTGDVDEHGSGPGEGFNLNVPLPPGTGDEGYAHAFERLVEPVVGSFDPDLLIVSAGADAGTVDPLGRNVVTKEGFEAFGRRARELAGQTARDRLVLVQEGGYQISHLGYAMLGTLEGVLGLDSDVSDPFAWLDENVSAARDRVEEVASYYDRWWDLS